MKYADRVKETTTSTGTTINLAGAASGFQGFVAAGLTGADIPYAIVSGTAWEVGLGTVTDASPDTLARDTILASSNSGSAITLSGTSDVYNSLPADIVGDGLVVSEETADSDITGVVNTLHNVDMNDGSTPFTAVRTFTLPAGAKAGQSCAVRITNGDADYELQIRNATGDTIDGTNYSGTNLTKLFITGELMVFRMVADDTWVTWIDGRIPCKLHAHRNNTAQSVVDNTWDKMEFTTANYDVGDCYDSSTNYRWTARRGGTYHVSTRVAGVDTLATGAQNVAVYKNGSLDKTGRLNSGETGTLQDKSVECDLELVDGDYLETWVDWNFASGAATDMSGAESRSWLEVVEILGN